MQVFSLIIYDICIWYNAKGLLNVAANSEAHAKDAWTLKYIQITCRWNKLHAQVVAECNHYLYIMLKKYKRKAVFVGLKNKTS